MIACCAMLSLASCDKAEDYKATGDGIKVVLATLPPQTKATVTPGDGLVSDGGGIFLDSGAPDLQILIFDQSGNLSAYYPHDALSDDKPTHRIVTEAATSNSALEIEVTFKKTKTGTDFSDGNYSLYAIANTEGLWSMVSSSSASFSDWSDVLDALIAGTLTEAEFKTLRFDALAEGETPSQLNSRLPLSATGSLVISNGSGMASAQMLRCLCKVNLTLANYTGEELTLDGLTLGQFNASTGYLLKQQANDIPAETSYSVVPILQTGVSSDDITIGYGDDPDETDYHIKKVVSDKYLFPNANEGKYQLSLRFGGEHGRTIYTWGQQITSTYGTGIETKEVFIRFYDGSLPGYVYYDEDATGTKLMIKNDEDLTEIPTDAKYRWRFREVSTGSHRYDLQNAANDEYIYATGAEGTYYQRTNGGGARGGYAFEFASSATKPSLMASPVYWEFSSGQLKQYPTPEISAIDPMTSPYFVMVRGKSLDYTGYNTGNTEPDVYLHSGGNVNNRVQIYEAVENIRGLFEDLPIRDLSNRNVSKIDRNQNLDITIRISKSSSFGYVLDAWTENNESIHFD